MNFHQLHIFDTVAKHLSFAKASKKLYLSQPTLSVHMQKFEKTIQVKLFEQIGNQIYLTEAGRILFDYTQKIKINIELHSRIT